MFLNNLAIYRSIMVDKLCLCVFNFVQLVSLFWLLKNPSMRPSDQRNHNDYKNCPSYNHKANGYTGLVSIVIKASFSYTSA